MLDNGSVTVAIGIMVLFASIGIVSIVRYKVEDALKIFGVLSGILGVMTGAFVSYFFTHQKIEQQHMEVVSLNEKVENLTNEKMFLAKNTLDFTKNTQRMIQAYNDTNELDVTALNASVRAYQVGAMDYKLIDYDLETPIKEDEDEENNN